jgi:hypothetical protein
MKFHLIFLIFLLTSKISISQTQVEIKITGRILSLTDSLPIENTSIALYSINKINYSIANNKGIFFYVLDAVPDTIIISSVGFTRLKIITFASPNEGNLNLGNIYLSKNIIELATIEATGKRKIVEYDLNKVTYNVVADPENTGLNSLDVIQKVPLIDVVNNKVRIKGDNTPIVLLNGRNSSLINTDPVAFLKSIPASYLSKIEINTDSPAKYKMDGYEYVINIVTNKKLIDGVFGSVNSEANTFGGYSAGGLVMFKKKKINLTANPNFSSLRGKEGEFYQSNINRDTQYKNIQTGITQNQSNSFTGNAELTFEFDSLRLLSLSATTSSSKLLAHNDLSNNYYYNELLYNNSVRNGFYKDVNDFNYYTLDYEVLKNKKRDILTYSGRLFQNQIINSTNFIDRSLFTNSMVNHDMSAVSKGYDYSAQIDFSKFVNKNSAIETGIKEIFRVYKTENQIKSIKNSVLDYSQFVSVIYCSYIYRKDPNYFRIGFRAEQSKNSFSENNIVEKTVSRYFNLLPNLTYSKSLKNNKSLSFKYNLNVYRPSVSYITTAIKYSNIENLQTGNQQLKPELMHKFDFTYNTSLFKKPFVFGIYFKTSPNSIVQIIKPYQDSLTLRTYNNSGKLANVGNTIYYSKTFFEKLTFRMNSDVSYIWLSGDENNISNRGLTYKIFLNVSYKLPWKFKFSSQNYIYGRTINLQGYSQNTSDLRFYLNRNFLDDKLIVGLTLYQPYSSKLMFESKYIDSQLENYSFSHFTARYLGFSISYDFGDFTKVMKRNKNKTISSDDLKT